MITGKINVPVKLVATVASNWTKDPKNPEDVNLRIDMDQKSASFTPSKDGLYVFYAGNLKFEVQVGNTTTPPNPQPEPEVPPVVTPPVAGTLIFDARRDLPALFNGTVKTYTTIGNISPGGLGLECRASGSPKIVSNTDGTFSLICGAGHGRFYGYVKNWDALLDIECAFWNQASGQDCSLKIGSRHNEGGDCDNRFGGYGFSVDRSGWGAKDESCHNNHTNSTSGSLPEKIETGKYFNIQFSVKHADKEIAKINGKQVLSREVANFSSKTLNEQNSYFWVRSNIDSGQGELRIRNLRMFAI